MPPSLLKHTLTKLRKKPQNLPNSFPRGIRVTPLRLERISEWVTELSIAMVEANQSREPFQLRDLRRMLETLLASLGVSRDVRGQVQSHRLGGVQQRHYDRHEYWGEKRATLALLSAHLVQLRACAKSRESRS